MLTKQIKQLGEDTMFDSLLAQVWGISLLILVLLISPMLVVLARNAISTLQVFAQSVELKAVGMKKQQKKQRRLVYRMIPKVVVEKMDSGQVIAESFESATLYFSSVDEFTAITRNCTALQVNVTPRKLAPNSVCLSLCTGGQLSQQFVHHHGQADGQLPGVQGRNHL